MLKIYGTPISSPTNKVAMCANALGLDYEYITINLLEGEHRSKEFLALHPAGKVPVMDDDGFVLFESDPMMKYLCMKHHSDLYPQEIKQQVIVDQWCAFVSIHIGMAMTRVFYNRIVAPTVNSEVDENSLKTGLRFLKRFLKVCDKQLTTNKYLAGDKFSIADICLLAVVDPCEMVEFDLAPYQKLIAWRENLCAQAFYQKVHKYYGEAMTAM